MSRMQVPAKPSAMSRALARDRLGVPAVLFFVLAGVAPLTVSAGVIPSAYATTGLTGIPAAFIVIAFILALFAVGYVAMTRHITNAGACRARTHHPGPRRRCAVAARRPRRARPARRVQYPAGSVHHRPADRPVRGVRRGAGGQRPGRGAPPAPSHSRRPPRPARTAHRHHPAGRPPRHARSRGHPRIPGSLQPRFPSALLAARLCRLRPHPASNCPADRPSTPCGASPTTPTTWETTRERPAGR